MSRSVAITGCAAVTPLGLLTDDGFADRARPSGDSLEGGIGPVRRFDASGFPVRAAAEVEADDQVALGMRALRAAVDEAALAGLAARHGAARVGVWVGAEPERITVGDWAKVVAAREGGDLDGVLAEGAYGRRSPSRLADAVALAAAARGPRRTLSMACVSSAAALAAARRAVAAGEVGCAIVVGAALNVEPLLFAGFCLLGAMSPAGACRPFDARRDGFILADGAAAFILEDEDAARRDGRPVRGRLRGAAVTLDAWRMTDPHPDGRGALAAMRGALADAEVAPESIALVKAHATGTVKNDEVEARAIHALVGGRPPVLAVKGALGHSIAASGAVEAIAALAALRRGAAEPTVGLEAVDPALPPIALTAASSPPRPVEGTLALCNTFGFGGINCALVLEAEA